MHATNKVKIRKSSASTVVVLMLLFISCIVVIGIVFAITLLTPMDSSGGPSTNSLIFASVIKDSYRLTDRIRQFLPIGLSQSEEDSPPWEQEFWTPIDLLDVQSDAMVVLCKLNFKEHAKDPHLTPMFKDLVGISKCVGNNRRRERLSALIQEIKDHPDDASSRVVKPTGFVFHESRVGSTLVANFLASDPYAMVFSESNPIANAILHCESCDHQYQLQLFRDITAIMGRSPFHRYLFFKFQSITVTKMQIALEAFPDTPWAFIFRQPVQTMMSHLDPLKNNQNNAPCMRSKRHPPSDVKDAIAKHASGWPTPNEAWCAAHLGMLSAFALRSYEKYGTRLDISSNEYVQRGVLVNYEALPGFVPRVLLPLFGVSPVPIAWLARIRAEAEYYSKGRGGKVKVFVGDSEDKDERATRNIQKYADLILQPSYDELNRKAVEALKSIAPELYSNAAVEHDLSSRDRNFSWKSISELPITVAGAGDLGDAQREMHSKAVSEVEFRHWLPFSNHHSSLSFEPANCPLVPDADYPKTFSMVDITNNWNADNTEIPPFHYDSICHFDHQNNTQLQQAYAYRKAEKPFIVYNIPEVDAVVKKWNDLDYLHKKLGNKKYRTEVSSDNHFMYWKKPRGSFLRSDKGKQWKQPTDVKDVRFADWIASAAENQNKSLAHRDHQYFRVSSDAGNNWLFDELTFFKPVKSLMLVEPREQKGIHCRFGMRSVIAEAHFDGSRNSVVELLGLRRWILTHPDQCVNMHMLDKSHPSGRHSEVDWSKPDVDKFPNFAKIQGNEVILRPGDFLFVPTYWIHYIVSLNINIQCNSRSGVFHGYDKFIRSCGF